MRTSIGVFWINTVCTLKCKKCITLTPYHKKALNFPKERIYKDIEKFFSIYEWADHIDVEGGESLLHKDLPGIIEKAFEYRGSFGRFHILTNGTILPNSKLIEVCKKCRDVFFIIDDYGPQLSVHVTEIKEILEKNNIDYRVDVYHGENQYYGGWVDFGNMQNKEYTLEEKSNVFQKCRQAHCGAPYIKNGKMFLCSIQAAGVEHIPLKLGEYVDFGGDSSQEELIEQAKRFGSNPIAACAYCNGFDVENASRYAAAEQITEVIAEKDKICL